MAAKHVGLGRGLGALIKEVPAAPKADEKGAPAGITRIAIESIRKNPFQPRHAMEREPLADLVNSIREKGILQPLLVRPAADGYELIAGERRLTAACEAQLKDVPVVIMKIDDREALEIALIENLQRENLNVIEEADGYRELCEKFSMTQEDVAARVGKSRAAVANTLRILGLPDEVKKSISKSEISAGHAKVLLGLEIPQEQSLLAKRVVKEGLSVRALEKIVNRMKREPKKPRQRRTDIPEDHLKYLSNRLHQHFGTAVTLTSCKTLPNGKKSKGTMEIDFYSSEELDRILSMIGITEDL